MNKITTQQDEISNLLLTAMTKLALHQFNITDALCKVKNTSNNGAKDFEEHILFALQHVMNCYDTVLKAKRLLDKATESFNTIKEIYKI
jgi:hypothetical protein